MKKLLAVSLALMVGFTFGITRSFGDLPVTQEGAPYQPGKPAVDPSPSGNVLSAEEQMIVAQTSRDTVQRIESHSYMGDSLVQQAKNTSRISLDINSDSKQPVRPDLSDYSSRKLESLQKPEIKEFAPLDKTKLAKQQKDVPLPSQSTSQEEPLKDMLKELKGDPSERRKEDFPHDGTIPSAGQKEREEAPWLYSYRLSDQESPVEELSHFLDEHKRQTRKLKPPLSEEDKQREEEALDPAFNQELEKKIMDLIKFLESKIREQYKDKSFFILDAIDFGPQLRAINRLLNPPARLHPWLKWLFYLSRVSPDMIQAYRETLDKRDEIYMLASKSNGKLKIRYQGRILDVPIYVWPDQAQGRYELILTRSWSAPAASAAVASPSVPPPTS